MPYLLLAFILIPVAEIYVLLQVGDAIGTVRTVLMIVATGVAGAYLARMQGLMALQRVHQMIQSGQAPTDPLIDALMVFVAGVVLLTPGFITDLLGLCLLFPATRQTLKFWLKRYFKRFQVNHFNPPPEP